jgi:hypothetical protein
MTSNPIADSITLAMQRKTKSLKEGFAQIAEQDIPTVPEAIFVRDFLPLFSGEVVTGSAELLSAWYLIAGSPYNAVHVVNTFRQTVATVPPILSRDIAFPDAGVGGSLLHAFEVAKQSAAMSPRLATRMIDEQIAIRYTPIASTDELQALEVAWKALMSHYGKGPVVPTSKAAASEESDLDW